MGRVPKLGGSLRGAERLATGSLSTVELLVARGLRSSKRRLVSRKWSAAGSALRIWHGRSWVWLGVRGAVGCDRRLLCLLLRPPSEENSRHYQANAGHEE